MLKPKSSSNSGSADDIEAAFYEALQAGDIDRIMACWGDDDEMVCIHPGGTRLVGLAAIRSAFEALFSHGPVRVHAVKVNKLDGLGASVHSVLERIEVLSAEGSRHAYVMATNVYHKTVQGWRMVAHHASPASAGTVHEAAQIPQRVQLLH
ncbi:MAG: nuclear transport factor 2 family protein [Pseudomonadota bacterium]|nr:nuclear transport factor 2 family protein [Pseudomonadota bacterium]